MQAYVHISGSQFWSDLLFGDLLGRCVDAQLLQRVDDLSSRAHRHHKAQHRCQRVKTDILRAKKDKGRNVCQAPNQKTRLLM